MDFKFSIQNFNGDAVQWYESSLEKISAEALEDQTSKQISHHIFIIDRSGSMYGVLQDLKHTLIKIMTLEEYRNAEMKVSLLSYASQGDLIKHFERVAIDKVMQKDSAELKAIEAIQVAGVTCISQALEAALELIDDEEFTAISLHSDGYANDSSYQSELKKLEKLAITTQNRSVMINTIAHSSYSDFNLLSRVANLGSGSCVLALNIQQVYDMLHDTSRVLLEQSGEAIDVTKEGEDFWSLVAADVNKFISSKVDRKILGVNTEAGYSLYRFKAITQEAFKKSKAQLLDEQHEDFYSTLAVLARSAILQGRLNQAKYCLATSQDQTLLSAHGHALAADEIGQLAMALERAIFDGSISTHQRVQKQSKSANERKSVLQVLSTVAKYYSYVTVDQQDLAKHYQKRTLSKKIGVRNEDGSIAAPEITVKPQVEHAALKINSIEVNRNTANVNMTLEEPIHLFDAHDKQIKEVAGIDLTQVRQFKAYTLIGDGKLNVSRLTLNINHKTLYNQLKRFGVIEGDYTPGQAYVLKLDDLPLVDYRQGFKGVQGHFPLLAQGRALRSFCAALIKGKSDVYTDEQLQALKDLHLTSSLNINLPKVAPNDLDDQINQGKVDVRISYQINLGSSELTSLDKLPSANAFLNAQYIIAQGGTELSKASCDQLFNADCKEKPARKETAASRLLKPLFDDLLGIQSNGQVRTCLQQLQVEDDLIERFLEVSGQKFADEDETVAVVSELQKAIFRGVSDIFSQYISPVVFYIGCTGLVPDQFNSVAYNAEEIKEVYPLLKPAASESDATFFNVGEDTLLSIYTKEVMFSRT